MVLRKIEIYDRDYQVRGDKNYLGEMGSPFEPDTVALLRALCDSDSRIIDVGANIGLTALALSQFATQGIIKAIEPVPETYKYLQVNLKQNKTKNVTALNFAAGREDGRAKMYVDENNLASAFITDVNDSVESKIVIRALDDAFNDMGLDRIDLIKIDVEGFELEVLAGAKTLLTKYMPRVLLEMNHWCLNVFRRICIPEFHETLLRIFPVVYAVDYGSALDFRQPDNINRIFEEHILRNRFMHIVAGFDAIDIEARLSKLDLRHPFCAEKISTQSTLPLFVKQKIIALLQFIILRLQT